jgi:hypothetical protein
MRKITVLSLFVFFVCTVFNSPASFADGAITNVEPNAVKVECVNLTGRTSNKLIDLCCIDSNFNLTGDCLGNVAPPLSLQNMSRTCIAPGMHLVFTPTFVPCECGDECGN